MTICGRMSRGECQPENQEECPQKTRPARATIGRCNSKSNGNVIVIDGSKIDVVIIDAPETSNQGSIHLDASSKLNKACSSNNIISIDDERDDDGFICADRNAPSSKTSHPSSTAESDDECQVLSGEEEVYSKSPKWMFDIHPSECSTSESDISETEMSEMSESDIFVTTDSDDDSDCEIMDDSTVNFREEWEKAALKKKMETSHALTKEGLCAFQSHNEPGISMSERAQKKDGFLSANDGTQTVPNSEMAHSDATMSTNGKGGPPLDGFTEESLLNCKTKHSADDLDHRVEDIHRRQSSQNKNESLSKNLHRARQRLESLDHEVKSDCGQDAQAPKSFPCNSWMQHDPHGKSDKAFPMHKEGVNNRASLFTDGMLDMQQDEDVPRHGSSYSCANDSSSQHMPESETRNVECVSEDIFIFHPHHEPVSSELDTRPGEVHTDLYAVCSFGEEEAVSQGSLQKLAQEYINLGMMEQSSLQNVSMTSDVQKNIIGEWKKRKKVKECRLAEEEEWASKRRQLQIQTEEMQRLQKRKKAETLRLLEMEKRQKQRLEEMRDCQKQEEESINLKDQLRAEIRKELENLEMKYRDMASLLRGLGVNVSGGLYPMPHEVNAAYRQALLRFHPDRASRTDIRQQVEAEEKFKLISRMKEKLLLGAYY